MKKKHNLSTWDICTKSRKNDILNLISEIEDEIKELDSFDEYSSIREYYKSLGYSDSVERLKNIIKSWEAIEGE